MPRPPVIPVWDLPTRIFHWLLVTLIACAWLSYEFSGTVADPTMVWHKWNGFAIAVLIIWRVLWGVVGSPASRFVNFLTWPWRAAQYAIDLVRGRDRHYLGHNPLGSYMILALLGLVTLQVTLGLFATEHNFAMWGPLSNTISSDLSESLTKWHATVFDALLVFIAAHVIANALYRIVKGDRLIEAMVTGSKPADTFEDSDLAMKQNTSPWARALLCLLVAIAIFVGSIYAAGGKFS